MRMNLQGIARFLPPACLARSWPQATLIVCLGCLQMAGDIFDLPRRQGSRSRIPHVAGAEGIHDAERVRDFLVDLRAARLGREEWRDRPAIDPGS